MKRSLALLPAAPLLAVLAACQTVQDRQQENLVFAQSSCGGCHAVEANAASPNPEAPGFANIVNREGLTENTLAEWLRDAHNYPEAMSFTLEESHVRRLAAHMLTLRREGYEPPIY